MGAVICERLLAGPQLTPGREIVLVSAEWESSIFSCLSSGYDIGARIVGDGARILPPYFWIVGSEKSWSCHSLLQVDAALVQSLNGSEPGR